MGMGGGGFMTTSGKRKNAAKVRGGGRKQWQSHTGGEMMYALRTYSRVRAVPSNTREVKQRAHMSFFLLHRAYFYFLRDLRMAEKKPSKLYECTPLNVQCWFEKKRRKSVVFSFISVQEWLCCFFSVNREEKSLINFLILIYDFFFQVCEKQDKHSLL